LRPLTKSRRTAGGVIFFGAGCSAPSLSQGHARTK